MADLGSRNISCISPQPASQASAAAASAAYFNQQLSLQSFSSLVSLDLSDNRLECFAGLAVLPSLQQLNLAANRLRSLQGLQPAPAAATEVSTLIKEGRQRAVSSGGIRGSDGGGRGEGGDGSGVACRQQDHEGSSSGLGEGGGDGAVDTAADAAIQPADSCGTGSINEAQPAGLPCEPSQQQQQQQQEETVQHADEQVAEAHSDMHQQQQPQQPQDQDSGVDSLQEHLGQNHDAGSTVGPGSSPLQCALPALMGFALLEVLDVSYNMLSGEALLGLASPLGLLPR
jgi:Leucine-rich repeat (LRR) protein